MHNRSRFASDNKNNKNYANGLWNFIFCVLWDITKYAEECYSKGYRRCIDIADISGHKYRYHIDVGIGKGNIGTSRDVSTFRFVFASVPVNSAVIFLTFQLLLNILSIREMGETMKMAFGLAIVAGLHIAYVKCTPTGEFMFYIKSLNPVFDLTSINTTSNDI